MLLYCYYEGDYLLAEVKNILTSLIRFGVTFIAATYLLHIIFLTLASHSNSFTFWLWGITFLLIALLDIIFVIASLFLKPKEIDTKLPTVIVCLLCFFAFLISGYVVNHSTPTSNLYVKYIGIGLNLLTYPITLVSLFSIRYRCTVLPEAHSIVKSGLYKYLRHPLYFSYILGICSNMFLFNNIYVFLISLALIILFILRAKFEERLLSTTLEGYIEYKNQTPFIPGIKWL